MRKRVGFIQTGGIGDLLMILPIADYYEEQGWEIVWPVDPRFVAMFRRAKPSVNFVPVEGTPAERRSYYIDHPLRIVSEYTCEKTIMFYVPMFGWNIGDPRLARSLKFDEYKYAMAGVPFRRKWQLKYERDLKREEALYESLKIDGKYVCIHEEGADVRVPIAVPPEIAQDRRIIRIQPLTDSIFDWRLTLERASRLILTDSCFANLVDQLSLTVEKDLVLRSMASISPVFAAGWNYVYVDPSMLTSTVNTTA